MINYTVSPFIAADLGSVLEEHCHERATAAQIRSKSHVGYLQDYLTDVGARTFVVEKPYTDKDFLEDYAAYYARCHTEYYRTCARAHFFSREFDNKFFESAISGDKAAVALLQQSYLGFIVLKPLPLRVIGRTCLAHYPGSERFFATQRYEAHLFGIPLQIQSLPFQEQDRDVAACATSALWTALHATGKIFHHRVPTPAEITIDATEMQGPNGRSLPALNGLNSYQIADAIRKAGLEPLALKVTNFNTLRLAASAYLRGGIPSVLLGQLQYHDDSEKFGGHAMTVVGFRYPEREPVAAPPYGTVFRSQAIDRLYVHDDGVGPFAKLRFDLPKGLGTSWTTQNSKEVILLPETLIIPLYHKIRVPVEEIRSAVVGLDYWVENARSANFVDVSERLIWDIQLQENADFKREVFNDTALDADTRLNTLLIGLPRFMWRASAYSPNGRAFDLLFDATDLVEGGQISHLVPVDWTLCQQFGAFADDSGVKAIVETQHRLSVVKAMQLFSQFA